MLNVPFSEDAFKIDKENPRPLPARQDRNYAATGTRETQPHCASYVALRLKISIPPTTTLNSPPANPVFEIFVAGIIMVLPKIRMQNLRGVEHPSARVFVNVCC